MASSPESPPEANPPRDLTSWLVASLYARRGVLISLGILAGLGFAATTAWEAFAPAVAGSERYRITRDRVRLPSPPAWVRDDPLAGAFGEGPDAAPLSILDPTERLETHLASTLGAHPWVRRVGPITKTPPNWIDVAVEYRAPVASVLMPDSLQPTDVDGERLPARDLARSYLKRLPRIGVAAGDPSVPRSAALRPGVWPTREVAGAARILAEFGPLFGELNFYEVQIDPTPGERAGTRFDMYRLRSTGNTIVLWGAAPGYGPPDEATFATKIKRLREAVDRYDHAGRLRSVKSSPAVIDVRNGIDAFRRVVLRDGNRLAAKEAESDDASVVK